MHSIDHYFELAKSQQAFSIDSSWGQGRSIFGGISAALILTHIESQTGLGDRDLRSVAVQFCGATTADEPCELSYQVLSEGKSIVQVQGILKQNGNIITLLNACFGFTRDSSLSVNADTITPKKHFSQCNAMPHMTGVVPDFIQHLDLHFTSGAFPFSGTDKTQVTGWMGFKDAPSSFTDSAILALIDAWPPAVLPMLKKPAPASSVTWSVEFIMPRAQLASDDKLYYVCDIKQADLGYAHTEGQVYHPNGQLLALTRQLVTIYDKRSK
jgi:acyl-CoA thioesterase